MNVGVVVVVVVLICTCTIVSLMEVFFLLSFFFSCLERGENYSVLEKGMFREAEGGEQCWSR